MRVLGYAPVISQEWLLGSARLLNNDVITIKPKFLKKEFYGPFGPGGLFVLVITKSEESGTNSEPVGCFQKVLRRPPASKRKADERGGQSLA